jgi:DNA invertase Pin-like site-specific DNA recombinase
LLANVTASVAEWERKIIGTRTREALAVRRAAGVKLGRPRQLQPAIANRIRAERIAGSTLQAVANRLNSEGTTTPTGRRCSPTLIRKVALQA